MVKILASFGCGSAALGSFVANPPEWYLTGAEAAEDDVVAWEELHRGNLSAASASSCKVVVPTVLFLQEGTEETEVSRVGTVRFLNHKGTKTQRRTTGLLLCALVSLWFHATPV